jgi:cytochrome c-type biogenesis CcmH protein
LFSCGLAAGFLFLGIAAAGEAGHGEAAAPYDPREFTPEQRARIEKLFLEVMCDCGEENWSRTLAGCPSGCAEPQKRIIREAVKRGLTDDQVIQDQLKRHGGDQRVLSVPDSPLASLFPYLALGAATALVLMVLLAKVRPRARGKPPGGSAASPHPGAARAGSPQSPAATEEERRIGEAVERDLQEMDG